MNIQLRDSKPLQAAIRKAHGRNAVPKAQLHPELLSGIIEASREGLEIRSEAVTGDNTGEANPIDLRNMAEFMGEGTRTCTARWVIAQLKQGESMIRVPSELIFTLDDDSKLAIRTQAVSDVTKLTTALPIDQTAKFDVTYQTGRITLRRADGQKAPAQSTLSLADLQTLAPQVGVAWDHKASNETNIERIQDAIKQRDAKKGEQKKKEPATV